MLIEEVIIRDPFIDNRVEKESILLEIMNGLTKHHYDNCVEYRRLIDNLYNGQVDYSELSDIPFVPVKLFKNMELKSISKEDIFKTMTSSGTSGQQVSKIYLDKYTANVQQKVLSKIVSDFTGESRMPMIILDCPSVLKDRTKFSARGAGILGFSLFGIKRIYAFDDDMQLKMDEIMEFLKKYEGQTVFLFGFTYMIWQYFYKKLKETGTYINLENGVLIHGGGWKKLESEKVSPEQYKNGLKEVCGINRVHDYYGMVEQTGCIYMECECGHLHTSVYSDVIIRNMKDFSVCKTGEIGAIQVLSSLAYSYPGHSILTEDIGCILGEDDCQCGRKGKYIKILGRMKNAEVRGCSDTFQKMT